MEENRPAGEVGANDPNLTQGDDYEYDESHDALSGPLSGPATPHRVTPPPKANPGDSGDYGYDEAHDFGTR